MKPLFSICHGTARPGRWAGSYNAWMERASFPGDIEYILSVDPKWGFQQPYEPDGFNGKIVYNDGPKSCVSNWNTAAAASTGGILILNADDMRPPKGWDRQIAHFIQAVAQGAGTMHRNGGAPERAVSQEMSSLKEPAFLKSGLDPWKHEFVLHVSVGGDADKRGLIILQILSRARYESLGYALWPEYSSMYSDDEFTEHAKLDGCYIDARDELHWLHHHPYNGIGKIDEVYEHQNRKEAYEQGKAIFERRRKVGFNEPTILIGSLPKRIEDAMDEVRKKL